MSAPLPAVPLIIFSHGNSFPGGSYSQLFKPLRARGYRVRAIDRFGHNPAHPVTSNWPHLVQQLTDFATPLATQNGPVFLVGHSLGGILRTLLGFSRASIAQIGGLAPITASGGEAGRRSIFLNGEAVFNTDESFPAHL